MHDPLLDRRATNHDDDEAQGDTNSAENTLYHDYRKFGILCQPLTVSLFLTSAALFYFCKKEAYYVYSAAAGLISLVALTLAKIGELHLKSANQVKERIRKSIIQNKKIQVNQGVDAPPTLSLNAAAGNIWIFLEEEEVGSESQDNYV